MCVIFYCETGVMPNKEMFTNAVYNNWHSWGIVIKKSDGSILMQKAVPESGENDPEFLYKILEENKETERFLHIRHTTKGTTNYANAQPFLVMDKDNRKVFFMHNGTLAGFGSIITNGQDTISDTREFCEKVLEGSLPAWNGPLGRGDYTDPAYQKLVIDKQWTMSSTGLFVSNELPTFYLGSGWKQMKNSVGEGKIHVSNESYFDRVTRGPEFDRREKIRKEDLARTQEAFRRENADYANGYSNHDYQPVLLSNKPEITPYNKAALSYSKEVLNAIVNIWKDERFKNEEDIHKLSYVTYEEWVAFCEEESEFSVALMFEKLTAIIHTQHTNMIDLQKKNIRYKDSLQKYHLDVKVQNA